MHSPKTYLLDTNVLLHDPQAIFKFQEHNVVLPFEVLQELDRFKSDQSEKGRNARHLHRVLRDLFSNDDASMDKGVTLESGGRLFVLANRYLMEGEGSSPGMKMLRSLSRDLDKIDNRILACLVYLGENWESPVTLVTKDINLYLKAKAIGLPAEDFLNDKVREEELNEEEFHPTLRLSQTLFQRFGSEGEVEITENQLPSHTGCNDYVSVEGEHDQVLPARYDGEGSLHRLQLPSQIQIPGAIPIRPRNLQQQFLMDALLDPDISLVTCYGKAGTGKTIVSTACALSMVAQDLYDGLSITRPVISLGQEIGFLPGDLNEKMMPWVQPYHDALNVLFPARREGTFKGSRKRASKQARKKSTSSSGGSSASASQQVKPYQQLMDAGILEIEALCYIRGRSIPRRFFILDEAQQLTPHEVKTVISRMSEGSKLVLIGDPSQIDNPYVDSQSNGLVYTRNRLRHQKITAHVKLTQGERSPLADLAVSLMR
ncbi:MAG: PhoH family protein [Opitutales bacterium]|nr:PhoH family protein [Opitutales bacterium]MCH8539201.1 PhoH family protein [Opitutales bacterium]